MRVYYGRVSSEQEDQKTSIERQMADGRRLKCDRILVDRESGRTDDRPQYQTLLKMILLGEVTEIYASRGDRVHRNQSEMNYFYNLCLESGVKWYFTDEPELNWDSSFGMLMRKQKAHEAEMESARLSRRQEKAYEHAEREGRSIARKYPLGYRISKDRKYEIDSILPDRSNAIGFYGSQCLASGEIARKLIDEFLDKQTIRKALKSWKEWLSEIDTSNSNSTKLKSLMKFANPSFHSWIKHPVLRGHTVYGRFKKIRFGEKLDRHKYVEAPEHEWRITWNTHAEEALISEIEWKAIQRILEMNQGHGYAIARSSLKPGTPVTLSTILRCRDCNRRFLCTSTTANGKMYRYYYCGGRSEFFCKSKGIPEIRLINELLDALVLKAREMVFLIEGSESDAIAIDPEQLIVLRSKVKEAEENYQLTDMKEFKDLAQQLRRRIEEIEQSRAKVAQQSKDNVALLETLADREYWSSLSPVELHENLRALVHNCWIEDGIVQSVELAL